MKPQRIRDPLHDLIEFDTTDFEQGLWDVLNAEEFQRLRRIKQLGFSELVYPGATHTRFAHSIGVFHTARDLTALIKRRLGGAFSDERAKIALAAALVHDVGHGPFSHAFESAVKQLDKQTGKKRENRHEVWTAEIIQGNTQLGFRLEKHLGKEGRADIASLLLADTPTDIYSAVVSSQFDADRLDYVRRDRLMTGAQHGGFDYSWLLANLEVAKVPIATDDEGYADVDSLVFGHKAFQAAESYVLGLFHLYLTVYFHKATRSAEKMITAIILRLGEMITEGKIEETGLSAEHPMVKFINERSLESYLSLDDSVLWGGLQLLKRSSDVLLAAPASRLLKRDLYKAVDVSFEFSDNDAAIARFRSALSKARESGTFERDEIFEDSPSRNPYKRRGYDTPEALSKVLIGGPNGSGYDDLSTRSDVVKVLSEKKLYRVYARDQEALRKLNVILHEVHK